TRQFDQCSHRPVSFRALVRSWNGVVRIIESPLASVARAPRPPRGRAGHGSALLDTCAISARVPAMARMSAERRRAAIVDAGAAAASSAGREVPGRPTVAWAALLERAIREGVEGASFRSEDPAGAAWRILSLVGVLALQVVANQTIVDRADMLAWAASATERELQLPPGSLAVNGATPPRA